MVLWAIRISRELLSLQKMFYNFGMKKFEKNQHVRIIFYSMIIRLQIFLI